MFLPKCSFLLCRPICKSVYNGKISQLFFFCIIYPLPVSPYREQCFTTAANRTARIVTNTSYDASASPLLSKSEWSSIDEIIKEETTNMVCKSMNNLAPKYLCNLFTKNSSRDIISLRSSETDLYVPFMNIMNGQESFSYRGAHLWNGLKATSKNVPSLFAFRRDMKQ